MTITLPRTPARPAPTRAGRREWLALVALFLPTLLVAIDNTILSFALPAISSALAPNGTELLWVVDIYPLVLAGLLVTMGTLGDRIGRRRLLMIGVAGFGAVSLVAAFATDATQLVAARAVLGFFGAMLMPSTLALLRALFADRGQRRTALAIWATGFAAGAALGPIVGGLLLQHFWWGSVFLVNVPVMVLLLVLAAVLLPESRMAAPGRMDPFGVLLSLLAMVPLVLAIKLVAWNGVTPASLGALLVAGLAGLAFVRRVRAQTRAGREPVLDVELFAAPVLRLAALANATTMFALTGVLFFSAQYLQLVLGHTPMRAGLLLLPGFLATVVSGLVAARLARWFPLRTLVPTGLLLAAAGYLLCALLGAGSGAALLIAASVLVGVGIGLSETLANDAIMTAAPADRAGAASAVSETAYEIGAVLGTAVLGSAMTTAYQRTVQVPAGLDPASATAARETLGGAVDVAAGSAGPAGPGLLASAQAAFAHGVQLTAGLGTAVLVAVAATVVLGLRRSTPAAS
ncbi:MFS transporter [Pseudonocardia bannensis]|uniref:MFS transporter n=1 Tax=Pseudonocardia bannensis TaxID=630973 RepID=A0A848DFC3_9PSEU|nr:MFS transporter [Pseudonocardia bannensis]NMH91348.1 MFS transporter [Pseudonocardia bannensis]